MKFFYHYQTNIKPYITLKLAISKNGFSKDYNDSDITSSETQYYMHKYRLIHDAIAVGYNTYKEDNPRLSKTIPHTMIHSLEDILKMSEEKGNYTPPCESVENRREVSRLEESKFFGPARELF